MTAIDMYLGTLLVILIVVTITHMLVTRPGKPSEPEYSRDTVWTTYEGKKVAFKDMTDEHIVNVMSFLFRYDRHPGRELLPVIIKEIVDRGLSYDFIYKAPYPHKDKDGNMVLWSYTKNKPVPARSKR